MCHEKGANPNPLFQSIFIGAYQSPMMFFIYHDTPAPPIQVSGEQPSTSANPIQVPPQPNLHAVPIRGFDQKTETEKLNGWGGG